MLMPLPESDLSLNVLSMGAEILNIMKKESKPLLIEDLLQKFLSIDEKRKYSHFFDTLTFLYTSGFIIEKGYTIRLKNGESQATLF